MWNLSHAPQINHPEQDPGNLRFGASLLLHASAPANPMKVLESENHCLKRKKVALNLGKSAYSAHHHNFTSAPKAGILKLIFFLIFF